VRARPLIVSLLFLAGCGPRAENPAVSVLLNAEVRLQRGEHRDSATLDVTVHEPGTIVALVDESGVDVALKLRDNGSRDAESDSAVESNFEGEGLEITTLEITQPTTVTITIDGPRDWPEAGRVKLSVTGYPARSQRDTRSEAMLKGYREWSLGSGQNIASDRVISDALPHIDRAISAFADGGTEGAPMAAHARLLRARTLYFHETDWRAARADAARAADEFASLPVPDLLNAARARRLEAAALQEISFDKTARDPSAAEADAESREILRVLTASGSHLDNVGMARSFNLLGIADLSVHQWSAARTSFEAAVRRYEEAAYRPGIMQSRRNLGVLATSRGDLPLAEKVFADCLRDVAWLEEPDLRASLYNNAGAAAANIGASDAAIERFLLAAQLAREHNLKRAEGRAMHGLGLEYYHRGDLPQAGVLLEQALAIRESINDGPGLYASYRAVGTLRRLAGDLPGARERHLKSLARAPNVVARMMVRIELALDEKSLGNRRAAIRFLREAVGERLETASHPVMADAQLALAELLLAAPADAASLGEAESLIARALETAGKSEDILLEINARRVLAMAAVANGERGTARTQLERAIRLSLKYRRFSSSGELQASALAGQHQVFQDYITLLMADSTRHPSPHAASEDELNALRVLETVRATMFAANRTGDTRSGELDSALLTLAAKRNSIATLLERSKPPTAEIVKLQLDAANLRARIDRLRAGAASSSEVASGEPAQLASRLRNAVAGHAHLSYLLGDKSSYVWERTADGTRVWILPAGATALSKRVASLSAVDRLQNPAAFDARLEELSSVLMPAGLGGPGASRFEIVADGVLADVPFSGLRSPSQPSRRLIDTHSIVMVTSGTWVPQKPKASRRWQLVAIADSPDTSDLPAASSEIRRIAAPVLAARMQLLGGAKSSAAQLEAFLREGIDVLHVATHGHADAQQPLASRLVLHSARGAVPDTYVTAGQIQEWEGSVGLVFLSACDTAVGQVRFGDTVPGLQRAFLRAGAHEVIATLWPIEDRLAEEFAISFYEARAAGLGSAEALAQTQRAWAASENIGDAQIGMRRRVAAWAYALYAR
jgi:tetratricopeptide (TPR) repeat protein